MQIPVSCRHRKTKNRIDIMAPPGMNYSIVRSLLPDTWGRITSNRTHRVSMQTIREAAVYHRITVSAIRKMLEKMP